MKIFKLLLKVLGGIFLLVILIVGVAIFLISDGKDEVNIDYFNGDVTINEQMDPILERELTTLGETYKLEFDFNEEVMNKILYAILLESVNDSYNPKYGTTNEEKYLMVAATLPDDIPFFGGKDILIKHAYAKINKDVITFAMTIDAAGLKTKLSLGLKVSTTEDAFVFEIVTLKFGKLNLISGLGKWLFNLILGEDALDADKINQTLKDENIPFTFDSKAYTLISTKESFANFLADSINTEEDPNDFNLMTGIITNPKYDLIAMETKDNKLFLRIDLGILKVDEKLTTYHSSPFDSDAFLHNKIQTLAIQYLATNQKILTFSESELTKLINDNLNSSNPIKTTVILTDNNSIEVTVLGIVVSMTQDEFSFRIIIDINGLKTVAVVTGDVVQESKGIININLRNEIIIGNNNLISNDFLDQILSDCLSNDSILKYYPTEKRIVISSDVFSELLALADASSEINIVEIAFANGALNVYVEFSDSEMDDLMDSVSKVFEEILTDHLLDTTQLVINSAEDAEMIENINKTLTDISSNLSSGENKLSADEANGLIDNINALSHENQEILYNQFNHLFTTEELEDLYSRLFMK